MNCKVRLEGVFESLRLTNYVSDVLKIRKNILERVKIIIYISKQNFIHGSKENLGLAASGPLATCSAGLSYRYVL
jgi:hypothetical protein